MKISSHKIPLAAKLLIVMRVLLGIGALYGGVAFIIEGSMAQPS